MNLLATVPGHQRRRRLRGLTATAPGLIDVVLDGAALTDQLYGGGTGHAPPSLDSIQEFQRGGQLHFRQVHPPDHRHLTTKGGTNELHGSLFETNRNNGYGVARARDNFTNTAAKLDPQRVRRHASAARSTSPRSTTARTRPSGSSTMKG